MEQMTMPMWVNVFIGIAAALGGWEALKYVLSLRANRRKEKAEAGQQEALAGQSDADLRQKELELLNQIVDTTKQQYGELKGRYDELLVERKTDREETETLRRDVAEMRLWKAEQERTVDGLQRAFTESEARRKAAERLYCSDEKCPKRRPPLGTYDSTPRLRNKKGQFVKFADNAN